MSRKDQMVMIRLDEQAMARLLAACERYSVSRSALLRDALEQWLTLQAWKSMQQTQSSATTVQISA